MLTKAKQCLYKLQRRLLANMSQLAQYQFQKWIYDSTESATRMTQFQVGTMDINLVAHYTLEVVPFDFALTGSPSSQPVTVGQSTTFAVACSLLSGLPEQVTLAVSGLPTGATASFSPASGIPPFSSLLTIQTSPSTPVGSFILTISGFASVDRSTSVTVVTSQVQVDKGTILVSALVGSAVVANGQGEITDPSGTVVASFSSTPFSWDQAIVGTEYTVVCRLPDFVEQTSKVTVTTAGQSKPIDFQFVSQAGFPLWAVAVAGGTLVVSALFLRGGKKGRRK